jgi:outer membrane protein with beta-barrel domain
MRKLLVAPAMLLLFAPAAMAASEFSLVIQGGVSHYEQSLSGSNYGAAYGARIGLLPLPVLGIELGYLGTRNNISANTTTGLAGSTLSTNEGYADLRVNILPGVVTPYIFGGYGLTWVSGADASGVSGDHVSTLPFGAGLEFSLDAFKIGARFQYNYLFNQIFSGTNGNGTPTSAGVDKGGHSDFWAATIDLGVSFR